jgi:hypothetical protein
VRHAKDVQLDVLVHVGMAGEGLDSVFVSEVVHLNRATISNQNDQENGRASRCIPGAPKELQKAYINVDSSSAYADWAGSKIMAVFDRENGEPPPDEVDDEREVSSRDDELPDEPTIIIAECELQHIDKGDPEVRGCAEAFADAARIDRGVLADPNHWVWDAGLELRKRELLERAKGLEGMSTLHQLKATVSSAVGAVASRAARSGAVSRPERSLIGDLMKRINTEMKRRFGSSVQHADEQGLRDRYGWLKALESTLKTEGVPPWLR